VASVYSGAAFLVAVAVVDVAGVALVITVLGRRATRRAP